MSVNILSHFQRDVLEAEYRQNKAGWLPRSPRIDAKNMGKMGNKNGRVFSNEMEVAKLSAPPNLEVRYVSCNESAKKRCFKLRAGRNSVSH